MSSLRTSLLVRKLVANGCGQHARHLAITDESGSLSFAQLVGRATALAAELTAKGADCTTVGLCVRRSANAVVGLIGILLAGKTYVPLDPSEPTARLTKMLRTGQIQTCVADDAGREAVAVAGVNSIAISRHVAHPSASSQMTDVMYAIFTSGSTGTPKAVEISHASFDALLRGARQWMPPSRNANWGWFAPLTFDISLFEILYPLSEGTRVTVIPDAARIDPQRRAAVIASERITHLFQPPAAARELAAYAPRLGRESGLRVLLVGGERLDFASLAPFEGAVERGLMTCWNLYGPTETTICATGYRITADAIRSETRSLIGRALPHVNVQIAGTRNDESRLDASDGELIISGAGVGLGYRGDQALTDAVFTRDANGDRVYRTGDLGRITSDGAIEYLGRNSGYVKVKGFRVEPGEVEAALCTHPSVSDAVVLVGRRHPQEPEMLIAGTVLTDPVTVTAIRRYVGTRLPPYMRPAAVVILDRVPRTNSGKVDRQAARDAIVTALSAEFT